MALLFMIFRKMAQSKWLKISLLAGMLFTVALVSSVPIYTEAILSRMLVKDLENQQVTTNKYPVTLWNRMNFTNVPQEKKNQLLTDADEFMQTSAADFVLPIREQVKERMTATYYVVPEDSKRTDPAVKRLAALGTRTGLLEHIRLIDGRMPASQPVDGVYEVLMTEQGLKNLKTVIDTVFVIKDEQVHETIRIKPVGVFQKKSDDDVYFLNGSLSNYDQVFLMEEHLFNQEFIQKDNLSLYSSEWYFVWDYSKMDLRNVNQFVQTSRSVETHFKNIDGITPLFDSPALNTIEKYFNRADQLRTLMWSLNVPVLIMLGFYMFMVSNLITDKQKNEIAVLRSRGAARWQIMLSIAIEEVILGAAAFFIGPYLGLLLTKMLGASNGFLSFVQRAGLPVRLNSEAYQYALTAVLCSFVMILIPVLLATRVSIVNHKQQMARRQKTSFSHKFFLDVIILGVAIYGLNLFYTRMKTLQSLGLQSDDLKIDPLQFVVPALFILGAGLLLLRLYPLLLRLIYWAGRKWWPPSLYSTLIQVGRSNSQYHFLMVFLIMTIATGVFSASAARTINNNTDDRIRYGNGADVVLDVQWPNDAKFTEPGQPGPTQTERIHYTEPPFEPYRTLPGVEQAAKVFEKENVHFDVGQNNGTATLIGIDTYDFGRTAWFRDRLLDHEFNDYLNLLASNPRAILISRTLADQNNVTAGDALRMRWEGLNERTFVVYGILDYFPTFNPNPDIGSGSKPEAPMLIVGNLQHIQTQLALEPYRVWLKMQPGFSMSVFYQSIIDGKLAVWHIINNADDLHKAKNDPFLLAINGVLTLGFIISIVVSFIGFMLYWILSLRGRTLQNGILRAMGISFKQLIGMLAAEQALTSGAAILIGALTGSLTSWLFVPVFQTAFDPRTLVPPFLVMFDPMDAVRLYTIVAVMISFGLVILGFQLSRMKIHQAIKLGED